MEDANAAGDLVRFALANEWKKMKRDGWLLKDGQFKPPEKRGLPSMSVDYLEPLEPIKIVPILCAGRKRDRDEMEEGGKEVKWER